VTTATSSSHVVPRSFTAPFARALLAAALVVLPSIPLHAQDLAGDWHGALSTPIGRLMLLVTIRDGADGTRTGELESIDQRAGRKIPLANVAGSADRLTFSVPAINATYDATWNASEQAWTGTFRQGGALPLTLKRGRPPALPVVAGLDGTWRGQLTRGTVNLRLVLSIRTSEYGTRVRLDSPDQGASGIEVEQLMRRSDSVWFRVPVASAEFLGALEGRALRGTWSAAGTPSAPVTFTRDTAPPSARVRTQWPITAKGYRAEEVSFQNPDARGVTIAGTVTVPEGSGPFPAVVLISGSGPQDRDETLFGHKPFAVLADHLSRRGIAVLRYDDRGFGRSTGDHGSATSADFATDANAAVRYLLGRSDIDAKSIGFVGHSEGGMIAPIAAATNDRVAFLVLLAGPGTRAEQLLLSQRRLIGLSQGMTTEQLDRAEPVLRDLFRAVRDAPDSTTAVERVGALLTNEALGRLGVTSAQRDLVANQLAGAWIRYFLRYEPSMLLSRIRVPVLAINGSLDRQVPPAENLAAIRTALARNPNTTVRELPGLNHLFQTARTGALGEYETIEETFAPSAMDLIAEWVRKVTGVR
jgi:uncharacterized protein